MRISSPSMAAALIRGATDGRRRRPRPRPRRHRDALFRGRRARAGRRRHRHGVAQPKEYTGTKIVRRGALPVGGDRACSTSATERYAPSSRTRPTRPGQVQEHDIWPAYVERVLSFIDVPRSSRSRSWSTPQTAWPAPCSRRCSATADRGASATTSSRTAPSRTTSPTRCSPRTASSSSSGRRAGRRLRRRLRRRRRPLLLRRRRGRVRSRRLRDRAPRGGGAGEEPGREDHLRRPRQRAVPETIERRGRRRRSINRVGHAFIKQRMREEGAVFAGEVSGHYYFRDFSRRHGRRPVPADARARLEAAASSPSSSPLRDALLHHGRDEHAGRRRGAQARRSSRSVSARRARSRTSTGSPSNSDDWHFNVRPSNTEPLLRLNLEARSEEHGAKRDEVLDVIRARGRTANRQEAAVQVLGAPASRLRRHGRAGHRLLRALQAPYFDLPRRVPAPARPARHERPAREFVMRATTSSTARPRGSTTCSRSSSAWRHRATIATFECATSPPGRGRRADGDRQPDGCAG